MSVICDKIDPTVQLPDEILCHVLSFVTLKDKLRSEAVNHKFQRCVIGDLKANPQPLELDLEEKTLNGYSVSLSNIFNTIQFLARKAKFSVVDISIDLHYSDNGVGIPLATERTDSILSLLLSESQCLTKVTSFFCSGIYSPDLLENFMDKCRKLSDIGLFFNVCPLKSESSAKCAGYPMDLGRLLMNRRVTEVSFPIINFDQKALADVFQQAIKPNKLRNVTLSFMRKMVMNMYELVNALSPIGSSLEELTLSFRDASKVHLAELFHHLALLPALRKCCIDCDFMRPFDQFVPVARSLFANRSQIKIEVTADSSSLFSSLNSCQIVQIIRQMKDVHRSLVVDFESDILILTLGNATIRNRFRVENCRTENCVQCQSFYPSVLRFLRLRAAHAADNAFMAAVQHFPNWQLDRCKVDKILDDLKTESGSDTIWAASSVENNEEHQSVTISFETKNVDHHLLSITIGCGTCLTNGCIKCINM